MTKEISTDSLRAARYLRGEMSVEDATQLEIELLENDALFQEVQLQSALIKGLQTTQEETKPSFLSTILHPRFKQASFAGMALLATAVVVQSVRIYQLNEELAAYQTPSVNIPVVTLQTLRSNSEEITTINLGQPATRAAQAVFRIDVSSATNNRFTVMIQTEHASAGYDDVIKNDDGFITLNLPVDKLGSSVRFTISAEDWEENHQVNLLYE